MSSSTIEVSKITYMTHPPISKKKMGWEEAFYFYFLLRTLARVVSWSIFTRYLVKVATVHTQYNKIRRGDL